MTLPQRFVISHPDETAFKSGGLRDYSAYRDLGVAEATRGLARAHVIRMIAPFRTELGLALGTSFSCMGWIISVSLPPVALLIVMIRHAAFVRPRLSLCLGMLSASALASAGLMMFHEIDATLMIFVWHTLAALILTGLAGIGAPIFRRFAGAHWRS